MAKPIQSEQALGLDRRQLLTSAAVIAVTGSVNTASDGSTNVPRSATRANSADFAASTCSIRPIPDRAVAVQLAVESDYVPRFLQFVAVHQRAVWDEVLLLECKRRGQPD